MQLTRQVDSDYQIITIIMFHGSNDYFIGKQDVTFEHVRPISNQSLLNNDQLNATISFKDNSWRQYDQLKAIYFYNLKSKSGYKITNIKDFKYEIDFSSNIDNFEVFYNINDVSFEKISDDDLFFIKFIINDTQ